MAVFEHRVKRFPFAVFRQAKNGHKITPKKHKVQWRLSIKVR
jgi:hypothetical protein